MRRFEKFVRQCGVAFAVCALAACGGVGDVGAPSDAAQVGNGGGAGAPRIQGTPRSSVAVGQRYSFLPTATDDDGGVLTFSIQNLPEWLTFDAANGRLTGTPTEADIGSYSGLQIQVSDGASRATLGPFTITVVAQGSGTASLSWIAPTENSDGSALTDLAGFVVLYGVSPMELTETITIDNPSLTTYVVENLTSGTWYFAVQAANASGGRSAPSEIASKTIG